MTKKLKAHQKWFRESNSWPARRFRSWAEDKDMDWWADAVGMAIATTCVVLVFLCIILAENVATIAQIGLP